MMSSPAKPTSRASQALEPFYFGSPAQPLFGCYSPPSRGGVSARGVVICPPIGQEYFRAHRALKQLATRLALQGVPALRFDYYACGDSAGASEDGRLARWLLDVSAAVDELRRRGSDEVYLVGLRLGASLALLSVAEGADIDGLALWDPVVDGGAYLRDLETQQQTLLRNLGVRKEPGAPAPLEILGFPLTEALRLDIERINLLEVGRKPGDTALVLQSESVPEAERLAAHLKALGVLVDHRPQPGPAFWVENRESALVPSHALQAILSWVAESQA
jgi:alpha/beta superfamily hydrolase